MTVSDADDRQIARHEAAHGIIARHYGMRIEFIDIDRSFSPDGIGGIKLGLAYDSVLDGADEEACFKAVEEALITLSAGAASDAEISDMSLEEAWKTQTNDVAKAAQVFDEACIPSVHRPLLEQVALQHATEAIDHYRAAVDALASRLLVARRIDGTVVDEVFAAFAPPDEVG